MKLVTIKQSHQLMDLVILKSMLEEADIECFLKNELTTQIMNHLPSMMVELQVLETDLERALKIMKEYEE